MLFQPHNYPDIQLNLLRRKSRLTIVDSPNPADSILDHTFTLASLTEIFDQGSTAVDKLMSVLSFCARWGLIANSRNCAAPCNQQMSLVKNPSKVDGYRVI